MDINKSITNSSFEFLTGFYHKHWKKDYKNVFKDIEELTFELALCKWASDKAYKDVCRTIKFKDKSSANKDKDRLSKRVTTTVYIYNYLKELSGYEDYDLWHKKLCEDIHSLYEGFILDSKTGATSLTYGQIQKWVNMTIKWLWIYTKVNNCEFFKPLLDKESQLHIPLDSFIIDYIKKEYKYTAESGIEAFNITEPWSQIALCDTYLKYQTEFRKIIKANEPVSAIEWELVHWKEALNMNK